MAYVPNGVKVLKPMEFHPEFATVSGGSNEILSKEEKMRRELGLAHEASSEDEEDWAFGEESSASKGPNSKYIRELEKHKVDSIAEIKELKKEMAEMSERDSLEIQRVKDQRAKLKAISEMSNAKTRKDCEDRLSVIQQEKDDFQIAFETELKKADILRSRVTLLEAQLTQSGLPLPDSSAQDSDAMNRQDVEKRLKRKIQRLQEEVAAQRTASEAKDRELVELQLQVQSEAQSSQNSASQSDLQKARQEIKNLEDANSMHLGRIKKYQEEIERYKAGGAILPPSTPTKTRREAPGGSGSVGGISGGGGANEAELLEQIAGHKGEIDTLKSQIKSLMAGAGASAGSTAAVSQLEQQLAQSQQALASKDKTIATLKSSVDEATARIASLEKDLDRFKKSGGATEKIRAAMVAKLGKQKAELTQLRAVHLELRSLASAQQTEYFRAIKNFYSQLKARVMEETRQLAAVSENYKKEMRERKRLFNLIQELKGNIRVYCRVRPLLPHEITRGEPSIVSFPAENELQFWDEEKQAEKKFEFEKVFEPGSEQTQVFNELEGLITSVMDGYNVCIFAYGQTGSGKTHTMEGDDSAPGVNPRALARLFGLRAEREGEYEYTITFGIMEIYLEEVRDLLRDDPKKKPDIRQGPNGIFVQDLNLYEVNSAEEVRELWKRGAQLRATSSNNVNAHSSRSHLILQLHIQGLNKLTNTRISSKLNLIDLAGSERVSRTQASGERFEEAKAINTSLSALGNCIHSISSKDSHVSFRSNKLTYLLQDSLNGDSKTLMIVQVAPGKIDLPETISSLQFASRARAAELGQAKKNISSGGPPSADLRPRSASSTPRPRK